MAKSFSARSGKRTDRRISAWCPGGAGPSRQTDDLRNEIKRRRRRPALLLLFGWTCAGDDLAHAAVPL